MAASKNPILARICVFLYNGQKRLYSRTDSKYFEQRQGTTEVNMMEFLYVVKIIAQILKSFLQWGKQS